MPLPTFLIPGSQKSGTSTLSTLVRLHPETHVFKKKEVHYFDWHYERGIDWYSAQFEPKPGQVEICDATPTYMYYPYARQRMIETLPTAKLVIILRDPVQRAYSHFWHSSRLDYDDVATFEEAVELEPSRLASGKRQHLIRHSYLDRGRYVDQLLDLERHYGRERMHVLTLDDLIKDAQAAIEDVFSFIRVDPQHSAAIIERWQTSRAKRSEEDKHENSGTYPPIDPGTRARLVEEFRPYNDRLAEWLGRDLSAWNA